MMQARTSCTPAASTEQWRCGQRQIDCCIGLADCHGNASQQSIPRKRAELYYSVKSLEGRIVAEESLSSMITDFSNGLYKLLEGTPFALDCCCSCLRFKQAVRICEIRNWCQRWLEAFAHRKTRFCLELITNLSCFSHLIAHGPLI